MERPENVCTTKMYNGKLTIRKNVRDRLGIEQGDSVTYEILKVLKTTADESHDGDR